jgi:hypothetical protein
MRDSNIMLVRPLAFKAQVWLQYELYASPPDLLCQLMKLLHLQRHPKVGHRHWITIDCKGRAWSCSIVQKQMVTEYGSKSYVFSSSVSGPLILCNLIQQAILTNSIAQQGLLLLI